MFRQAPVRQVIKSVSSSSSFVPSRVSHTWKAYHPTDDLNFTLVIRGEDIIRNRWADIVITKLVGNLKLR